METALREGGYPKFLLALRNAPEVGQLVLGGSEPFAIRYARETVEAGGRTIVVVTDKPVFFIGGGHTPVPSREPDLKWPCCRFSWTEKDRGAGRWPRLRACDPMAMAASCSTTTPRS